MSWLLANYKVVLEVASYVVAGASAGAALLAPPVSYTHLTLPTNREV